MARAVLAGALVVLLTVGGGVAVAAQSPDLAAEGPTGLDTEFTAVFTIGDRTIRQFRYEDGGVLHYTFRVTNPGRFPVTLHGLAEEQPPSRLLTYETLAGADGEESVSIGAGDSTQVALSLSMSGCETLSARAGSFATTVNVEAESLGLFDDEVAITLPEELRTGSPREAFCPGATATSRPRG